MTLICSMEWVSKHEGIKYIGIKQLSIIPNGVLTLKSCSFFERLLN